METKELQNRFTYHAPKDGQEELYEKIRRNGFAFADLINVNCPDGREKALAITNLEQAVFWANAAIARGE